MIQTLLKQIGETLTPQQMKTRLESSYPEAQIRVTDLTGTEDHYEVFISSKTFQGMSRIQRQRHVMAVFQEELKTGEVHALTLQIEVKEN